MMKEHRGISNDGSFKVSPIALLWLSRVGLLETMYFVNRNN